jgi:hypothetical protein
MDISVGMNFTLGAAGSLTISGSYTNTSGSTNWSGYTGGITFNSTSAGRTITTSGVPFYGTTILFNGAGNWTLQDAFLTYTTVDHRLGSLILNNFDFRCQIYTSNGVTTTRSINFGTSGTISLAPIASSTAWSNGVVTGFSTSGTQNVNVYFYFLTANGQTITINPGSSAVASTISFTFWGSPASAGGNTFLNFFNTASTCRNITFASDFYGTWNGIVASTCYGSITIYTSYLTSVFTTNILTLAAPSGSSISLTTSGATLNFSITMTAAGATYTLANSLTLGSGSRFTLTSGTLLLNDNFLTAGQFSISGTLARTINFATYSALYVTGTVFDSTTVGNLTIVGYNVVYVTNAGTATTTVLPGILTESTSWSFLFSGGAYALVFLGTLNHTAKNIDMSAFYGAWNGIVSCTVYGTVYFNGGFTTVSSSSVMTFAGTGALGAKTYNGSVGCIMNFNHAFNGIGSYWTINGTMNLGAGRTMLCVAGTLDGSPMATGTVPGGITVTPTTATGFTFYYVWLNAVVTMNGSGTFHLAGTNNQFHGSTGAFVHTAGTVDLQTTLSVNRYSTSSSSTRVLAFSGAGFIIIQGDNIATRTAYDATTLTGFTYTGTPAIYISTGSGFTTTILTGVGTEAQAMDFYISGDGTIAFLGTLSHTARNVDMGGFSGTWLATASCTIYGSFVGQNSGSTTASGNVITFGGTLATTRSISNGVTLDFPVTFGTAAGPTFSFVNTFTIGSTRTLSFNAGTFLINNSVYCGLFSSIGSLTRTMTFGGNIIYCNAVSGALISITGTAVSLTLTSALPYQFVVPNTTGAFTIASNIVEANAFGVSFQGAGTCTLTGSGCGYMDWGSFSGTLAAIPAYTFWQGLAFSSGMTLTTGTATLTFGATSTGIARAASLGYTDPDGFGYWSLYWEGRTLNQPVAFNGVGGQWLLAGNIILGAAYTLTHSNGNIDLNSWSIYCGTSYATGVGTKSLEFNSGHLVCPAATVTAFNNANPTGFTTLKGRQALIYGWDYGSIDLSAATAKTFVGGASSFNCKVRNTGAGTLTISGANFIQEVDDYNGGYSGATVGIYITAANNIDTLRNSNISGSSGSVIQFGAGTTQIISNFAVRGNVNYQTVLKSNSTTPCTLYKPTGIAMGAYIFPQYCNTSGGASWYARYGSTNNATSTGWNFGSTKYWIGGTGNWSDTSHWSLSSGGAGPASIPSLADQVVFNSSSGGGTSTLDSSQYIQQLTMTGYTGTLAFGSYSITLSETVNSTTIYQGASGYSVTGNPILYMDSTLIPYQYGLYLIQYVDTGAVSESNTMSIYFSPGYNCNFYFSNAATAIRDLDFTNFASASYGLFGDSGVTNIYGNLKLTTAVYANANFNFRSTSATTRTIVTFGANSFFGTINFNGVGGSWKFLDAWNGNLAIGYTMTLTNGTVDLNGFTVMTDSFLTATGTKNLTFNGGTLKCIGSNGFKNLYPTGFTTTAGTGTGKISMFSATAKTFVGGGSTYNCTLSQDGAGSLAISGSNSFTNITNGISPAQFVFDSGSTNTFTNWNVNGTAGNLVSITSSSSSAHTLSKSGAVVSADYLNLSWSTAIGTSWYAGTNSSNGGNNTGWFFTVPTTNITTGAFFLFF